MHDRVPRENGFFAARPGGRAAAHRRRRRRAGRESKTYTVSIIDDAYADGTETTRLRQSNPAGAGLGALSEAQLTITDNDAALGQIPVLVKLMPDLARLSGFQSAPELEASKQSFVAAFMARPEFKTKYGSLVGAADYVDEPLQTAGLPNHSGRAAWVGGLQNKTLTRGDVLRSLVESAEVCQKFYDRGFVVMQYFGYLRRDPDI